MKSIQIIDLGQFFRRKPPRLLKSRDLTELVLLARTTGCLQGRVTPA